jgi:hypothetical protein
MAIEFTLGVGFVKVRCLLTSDNLTITKFLNFGIGFGRFLVMEVFGFIKIPLVQFFKAPTFSMILAFHVALIFLIAPTFLIALTLLTIPTFFATSYVTSLVIIFDKEIFRVFLFHL